MKILLVDFSAKVGKEYICILTIRNDSVQKLEMTVELE